jgi:hypothetical protein
MTAFYSSVSEGPPLEAPAAPCLRSQSSRYRHHPLEHAISGARGNCLTSDRDVPDHLLTHLSPLGWEHVNLTGDYVWAATEQMTKTPTDFVRTGYSPTQLASPHEFALCPLMLQKWAVR